MRKSINEIKWKNYWKKYCFHVVSLISSCNRVSFTKTHIIGLELYFFVRGINSIFFHGRGCSGSQRKLCRNEPTKEKMCGMNDRNCKRIFSTLKVSTSLQEDERQSLNKEINVQKEGKSRRSP